MSDIYNTEIELKYHIVNNEMFRMFDTYKEYRPPRKLVEVIDELYYNDLLQVFNTKKILDDEMVRKFEILLEKMSVNKKFKQLKDKIINNIAEHIYPNTITPDNFMTKELFVIFCSRQAFYIFHQCIKQQLNIEIIKPELFDKLDIAVHNDLKL